MMRWPPGGSNTVEGVVVMCLFLLPSSHSRCGIVRKLAWNDPVARYLVYHVSLGLLLTHLAWLAQVGKCFGDQPDAISTVSRDRHFLGLTSRLVAGIRQDGRIYA